MGKKHPKIRFFIGIFFYLVSIVTLYSFIVSGSGSLIGPLSSFVLGSYFLWTTDKEVEYNT